jgi:hypothetical protein
MTTLRPFGYRPDFGHSGLENGYWVTNSTSSMRRLTMQPPESAAASISH